MKNVASVTMKLGSFVLTTVSPFTKPIAKKTATAPRNAPMSGRVSRRGRKPTRIRRSSPRCGWAAVSAIEASGRWVDDRRPPTRRRLLAGSLRSERGDLGRVRLVDYSRPRQDRLPVAHRVQVRPVQVGEDDRQVPLEILLLVDREEHPALLDLLDRAADVERARRRPLRDHVETRDRDVRVEAKEGVELI